MKLKIGAFVALMALAGIVFAPLAVHASAIRHGDRVSVAQDESVDSTVFLAGSTVTVAGVVHGDVFCVGQNVDITGMVEGDVFCAGQTMHISGTVLGSVRVAAQTLTITGPIGHGLSVAAQSASIGGGATVDQDATIFGSMIDLGGKVGRDAVIGGQNVTISGRVARDVTAQVQDLTLANGSQIGGALDYTSSNQATVEHGATVVGATQRHDPPARNERQSNTGTASFWNAAYWFGATLMFGLALLLVAPRTFVSTKKVFATKGGWALLAGLGMLILTPIVAVILMMTVIGLPLAIALLLAWIVALIGSFSYSSYAVGSWIAERAKWQLKWPRLSALALGVLTVSVLMLIPFVGGLFGFVALIGGLGAVGMAFVSHAKSSGTTTHKHAKA